MLYSPEMVYSTSDFDHIVLLRTLGFATVDMEKIGKRVTFHFEKPDECKETILKYMNGKLKVDPLKLNNIRNNIKSFVVTWSEND